MFVTRCSGVVPNRGHAPWGCLCWVPCPTMGDPDGPVPELASSPVDGKKSSRPRVRRPRGPHAARKRQGRSFMRRHLVAAGTFALLLATATGVAVADDDEH